MPENSADELILVVHGVGDPAPGETLSLFARSLADQRQPLTETQQVVWINEPGRDSRYVNTFSTHVRELAFQNGRSTLAEVYWGDISRVRKGTLGAIIGLVRLMFGLRFVAYMAGSQPGLAARGLQWVGMLISRIVHGPLLAVNTILVALTIAAAATELLWEGSSNRPFWSNVLATGCVGLCLLGAFAGGYMTKTNVLRRYWFWVSVAAIFLSGLVLLRSIEPMIPVSLAFEGEEGIVWFCRIFVVLLGIQWFSLVLLLIAMFGCWIASLLNQRLHRNAIHAAMLLPALSVGMWGLFLPIAWILLSHFVGKAIQVKEFDLIFQEAIPLLGTQILLGLAIGGVMALCLIKYTWWRESHTVRDFQRGSRPPRLIVNRWVQLATLLSAVLGTALVAFMGVMELRGESYESHFVGQMLAGVNKYAVGALPPLSVILLLSFQHLRPALDIAGDIVNHFQFQNSHDGRSGDDLFDLEEFSYQPDPATLQFPKREAIQFRVRAVLEYFRNQLPGRPKLTIVAHSQGTMIAIDALNSSELDWINDKFRQVDLVTMGSPFSHIYQYYFRHLYPPLHELHWCQLRRNLGRWFNIFRIDDFVGTEIHYQPVAGESFEFSNHPVSQRGHSLYWCDQQVLAIIRENRLCQSLVSAESAGEFGGAEDGSTTGQAVGADRQPETDRHVPDILPIHPQPDGEVRNRKSA